MVSQSLVNALKAPNFFNLLSTAKKEVRDVKRLSAILGVQLIISLSNCSLLSHLKHLEEVIIALRM